LGVNAAGAAMAGAPSVYLMRGRNFYEIVTPEDRERYRAFNESVCAGHKGVLEFHIFRMDGECRHLETRAAPLHDDDGTVAQLGVAHDITTRKQAEARLRESERNLRQLTETIPEMLWSATPEGAIDYCNARLRDYTGFEAEQVMGDGWTRLLHPDDVAQAVQEWSSCIRTGASYRVEVRTFHAADGTYRWCMSNARPLLDERGRILKWYGTVVDMHDWRQAQEELRHTQDKLAYMMRVITMGELTASIAHEVNQPLSGIMTNAGTCLRMLAADPPDVDGACETARRTIRDANRASEVIVRLRALFSGKELTTESMDLNEATREVIALSMSELQRHSPPFRAHDGRGTRHEELVMVQRSLVSVVDDDESVRESLPDLLRQFGFAVQALSSAEAFLAWECVIQTTCLILDIAMVGMSGPDLQQELTRRRQPIPIVFITAHGDKSVRPRLLAQGATECLFKPFSDDALVEALTKAIGTR
jgi:PAS domain S-box-containing protein